MRHVAARGSQDGLRLAADRPSWRGVLLAGAALGLFAHAPAYAVESADAGLRGSQGAETTTAAAAPAQAGPAAGEAADDGLGPRDVYLEADVLIDDRDAKTMTARGSVEARHQGRVLRANEVVYNTETGTAVARGDAVIINADGTSEFAQEVTLDDEMRAGVATAFAARLQGNMTLAAGAAIRRNENVNQLKQAIYTPCDICNEEGYKTPTWSVQASTIIQDREHHVIYYKNAIIRVKGVPVFYTPVFWHADPTADRRSGLLAPEVHYNSRLGFSYEQPYLWVISPSSDLTISPQFSTKVNPFLHLSYRQRFWSGQLNLRVGSTYEQKFDGEGKYGNSAARTYVLGDGLFQLTDKWRWGFGAEYVTDPTVLVRYSIDNAFVRRGPFTADSQRLISQAYTERQDTGSFLSVSAIAFQSLRVLQGPGRTLVSYDAPDAFPVVAPLVEARIDPQQPVLGGRLRMLGSAVMLTRDQDAELTPAGIVMNQGINSRRATGQLDWRASATFGNGMRVEPFVIGRGDYYSIDNPFASDPRNSFGRAIGSVGADVSWPFIRQTRSSSLILEPLLQVAISPNHKPNSNIPNEDSIALEFDETNLMSINRFTGFDLYEGGQRMNVGARASFNWGAGHFAKLLIGRSFRTDPDAAFYDGSGLEGKSSDWVTSTTIAPVRGFSLFSRSRLDGNSLRIRRQEAGIDFSRWRVSASARYLYNERDASGTKTQSVNVGATLNLTRNWGVSVASSQDLVTNVWPYSQVSVFYQDECIRVEVMYTHDETYANTIVPSDSVRLRLTLATLGGQGR